jgi:hypothetical protein
MPTLKKQSVEEAREIIQGFERGKVAGTKPLYTNGKTAVLAGFVRKFIADNDMTIKGFESKYKFGNTYIHALAKARQIQVGSFARIADAISIKPLALFDKLVGSTRERPTGGKAPVDPEVVAQAEAYLNRLPGEAIFVIPNVPDLGDIILNTADKTYTVHRSVRVTTRG